MKSVKNQIRYAYAPSRVSAFHLYGIASSIFRCVSKGTFDWDGTIFIELIGARVLEQVQEEI